MRILAPIVLTFLLSAATAADPKGVRSPELALEAYTLPNGLKVALHRDSVVPRVTVVVAYHVGSKNEKAGRTGFAHFFEHMMFRGTKTVPNYDIPLKEAGASANAFTNQDMTVYYETVPSNFLERALYLEAERMAFLPSALDQQKFDTEREVVKNERRQGVLCEPDQSALPRGHAGNRLRPAGRPAVLSEGIRAVLPGNPGRPDPWRQQLPDAREGRRVDRSRQSGTAAERGDESRTKPFANGWDARDRFRPLAQTGPRLVDDARTVVGQAFPGAPVRAEDALERDRRLVRGVEDAALDLGRIVGSRRDGRRPDGQVRPGDPHGLPARQGHDQPDCD